MQNLLMKSKSPGPKAESRSVSGMRTLDFIRLSVLELRILIATLVTFASSLILILALAGCATKSPPTPTQVQQQALTNAVVPPAWKAGNASTNRVADNWIASFDDTELNALVVEALDHNPDLRVAATRVEQAAQYVELAKAELRPSVNVLGTGGLNMGGGDVGSALQGISLGASWEPDLWGRMRYARNAAQATHASTQADFEYGRQSIAATVAKTWFTASQTWLQRQIAEDMVKSGQELVNIAEQRRRVGSGTEQDLALARASLGNFQDSAKQLALAHEQTLRAMELLLGRYPSAELQARHDLAAMPGPVPAGLPLEILERRPDMIAAERRVAAAFNRIGEAKAARLPRIILNANVAGIRSDVLQLKSDFNNPAAGVGGKLIAPIYKGGALQTQVRIRTLEQKEAVAQYAQLALRALGDVENALAASESLAGRESTLRQVADDNQRALDLINSSYRVGKADLRAVQQQQLGVYTARVALLSVQSEQLAQRVNLHLSLGGSWTNAPAQHAAAQPPPKKP
jgi:outer membrane protein, multidrug efflux system